MAKQEVPKSIRASLYIDGKPAQNSIKNVEQVVRTLRRELNSLTIGTEEWNAKMNQLKVHQATLSGIRKEVNGVGGAFGFLKTELGKFGTLAAGYLGFQFITNQFQNIIAGNARLSDSLADIRRVAGLTEVEVRRLDKSFGDLDTRTSKAGLREIAVVAGKLGVAKNDILGFVEATDMLVVALGDELGNADQVTTQLGKILNVFDGEVNGDNITRLGNAMVKLANDGVATAGFISDFTQRVSGIAKTANMALGPTLGLAAGLEELGARPESAATAIQKLLVTMAQDIPASAKVAKMGMNEFNQMFAKTPELALLAYAEGLTQNKNAFSDIAIAFKDAGEEGVRVVETITKLGERADFMRTKFDDGTVSLQGYNEIQDAFALKNETLGAKMEKLGKVFNRVATNKTLVNLFTGLIEGATSLMEVFAGSARESDKLVAAFNKQQSLVNNLEKNLVPLIDRYDELKTKASLSKDEQIELNTIIQRVRTALPEAATEFDKYGTAIAISTTKAREFIETQKAMLQYKNQDAIKSAKKDLEEYTEMFEKYQRVLKQGYTESGLQEFFFGDARMFKLNDKMRADYVQRLDEMGQLKKGAEELIKTLTGEDIEIKVPSVPEEVISTGNTSTEETEAEINARLKKLEKDKQAAEKLQEELSKINEQIFLNSLEESDKEVETIRLKYEKLRVLAEGNQTQLDEINRLEGEEAAALQEKITAKVEEETHKQYLAKQDAASQVATALMSEDELELEQTRKKYMGLLQMADKFELDKAKIIQAWADENAKIQERQAIAVEEKKQRESSKWKLTDKEYEQEKKDFMIQMASEAANATFDIIRNSNQAKLDAAVSSIERERDAELSNKNLTEDQKKRINEKYDAKIREEKRKAWKADQQAAIAQAIVNGAVAVAKVMAQTGILSPFAIPAIAAGTALQVATIASQKMPEFAVGGFSDKDPAGYVSQATIFNRSASGRPFVAGEAGKEWIAPNWMVNSPKYANIIGMLETARQEKRYFAGGGSTEVSPSAGSNSTNYDFSRLEAMMSENTAELKRIKEMKVEFVYKDYLKFKREMEYSMKSQGKS